MLLVMSSVQNAMASVIKSAVAWANTHWMIHWTRRVARITPTLAKENWSQQRSPGRVPQVDESLTHPSLAFYDSITGPWFIDGAPLCD